MENYKKIKEFGKVRLNEPLSKHTTNKIGGVADFFIFIDSVDSLTGLVKFLRGEGIEYVILGGGSNTLLIGERFEGVVVSTIKMKEIKAENNEIIADAGCATAEVAQFSIKNNLTGFEWGVGVPGTIGGAVVGNAGAMGREMKDSVSRIVILREGEILELTNEECEFGYRDSIFKHNDDVILRVHLVLEKSDNKDLAKKAMESIAYRINTQPQGFSSSGCAFKNVKIDENIKIDNLPEEFIEKGIIPAGWLIEKAGLKGESVGQAKVSETHGNFIVNSGEPNAKDILELIEKIKEKVYDNFGIELEEEIRIINL